MLSIQEISKYRFSTTHPKTKYLQDLLFLMNLTAILEAQEGYVRDSEDDRIRVSRFTSDIRHEISASISIERDVYFCRIANCFSADKQGLRDLMSDQAAMSAHHAPPRQGSPPRRRSTLSQASISNLLSKSSLNFSKT